MGKTPGMQPRPKREHSGTSPSSANRKRPPGPWPESVVSSVPCSQTYTNILPLLCVSLAPSIARKPGFVNRRVTGKVPSSVLPTPVSPAGSVGSRQSATGARSPPSRCDSLCRRGPCRNGRGKNILYISFQRGFAPLKPLFCSKPELSTPLWGCAHEPSLALLDLLGRVSLLRNSRQDKDIRLAGCALPRGGYKGGKPPLKNFILF